MANPKANPLDDDWYGLTGNDLTNFAKCGDTESLERIAQNLLLFLKSLDTLPDDVVRAMVENGAWMLGKSERAFLIERLQHKPEVKPGKTKKSGKELFCKFLSPQRPPANQQHQFKLAQFAWLNMRPHGELPRDENTFSILAEAWERQRKWADSTMRQLKTGDLSFEKDIELINRAALFAKKPLATSEIIRRAFLKYRKRLDS